MCTTIIHQHTCSHTHTVRLSICGASFRAPTHTVRSSPVPRHRQRQNSFSPSPSPSSGPRMNNNYSNASNNFISSRTACTGYATMILYRSTPCATCGREEAERQIPMDLLEEEEYQAKIWAISKMFPRPLVKISRAVKRKETTRKGSLLRLEVLGEDVCEDDDDDWGWAKEGEGWELRGEVNIIESEVCADQGRESCVQSSVEVGEEEVKVKGDAKILAAGLESIAVSNREREMKLGEAAHQPDMTEEVIAEGSHHNRSEKGRRGGTCTESGMVGQHREWGSYLLLETVS